MGQGGEGDHPHDVQGWLGVLTGFAPHRSVSASLRLKTIFFPERGGLVFQSRLQK